MRGLLFLRRGRDCPRYARTSVGAHNLNRALAASQPAFLHSMAHPSKLGSP
ncbi:MAG: hypothetical protein RL750_859 [Bacteroidota bacterium]